MELDLSDGKDPKTGQFVKGYKGGGRPKGSRNKLGEAFTEALYQDFQEHGERVIETVRAEKPDVYMRVVASLLPKEVKVEAVMDLTDDQLNARIRDLARLIEIGVAEPSGRGQAPQGQKALN